MQAGTMMFVVGNVVYDDYAALKKKIVDTFAKAHADGVKCRFYGPGVGRLHHGVINFNMTRVPYNQTDAADWTRAEHEARGDIQDAMHILKTYMPEFRDSYLLYAGPHIGCRESRRLLGEYVLTIQDLYDRKRFADCIGLGAHPSTSTTPPNTAARTTANWRRFTSTRFPTAPCSRKRWITCWSQAAATA